MPQAEPDANDRRERAGRWARNNRRRLSLALLFSLLFHALLFSLTFGSDEFGLPGFTFPWQQRRVVVPELRLSLIHI